MKKVFFDGLRAGSKKVKPPYELNFTPLRDKLKTKEMIESFSEVADVSTINFTDFRHLGPDLPGPVDLFKKYGSDFLIKDRQPGLIFSAKNFANQDIDDIMWVLEKYPKLKVLIAGGVRGGTIRSADDIIMELSRNGVPVGGVVSQYTTPKQVIWDANRKLEAGAKFLYGQPLILNDIYNDEVLDFSIKMLLEPLEKLPSQGIDVSFGIVNLTNPIISTHVTSKKHLESTFHVHPELGPMVPSGYGGLGGYVDRYFPFYPGPSTYIGKGKPAKKNKGELYLEGLKSLSELDSEKNTRQVIEYAAQHGFGLYTRTLPENRPIIEILEEDDE